MGRMFHDMLSRRLLTDGSAGTTAVAVGALAAALLAKACSEAGGSGNPLHVQTVGVLAGDLERELDALAHLDGDGDLAPDLLAEAALRCADLAGLAACNVEDLPADGVPQASSSVHLAAGAARALRAVIEAMIGDPEDTRAANAVRDARGAVWRADLAVRQMEELLETAAKG